MSNSGLRELLAPMRLMFAMLALLLPASPGCAANATVKDGATLQLAGVTYRLDGVDAPEFDQICLDDHADPWTCGVEARDQLTKLIGARGLHCEDVGADKTLPKRRAGLCTVDGETSSLNQLLVRQGFALNFEPSAKGSFKDDEAAARNDRRGLWRGCFVAPQEFRHGKKDGTLLGAACRSDKDREIRQVLFPEEPAAPPGCNIKAKFAVRARVTGNLGIYHLQGCRSYAPLTKPDRWFCSEDDAQAAGFRRAYNCRAGTRRK
ncbi:Endonuclease YncB, thermonuclease family [Bradyrhizobium erythrophlei]|jgi:endonuclease YncB( thermonuclease family)|uniref:Endonuclease YncB, thermonuclease family n=2 Tax=Bradyrhizobium erythrophlei TaxID=1437360 RepID=A0A1M5JZR7_9BRAD|nr:Endonuclease YncB, thermonuclease family [Bradyrhizobium erythrophlei]